MSNVVAGVGRGQLKVLDQSRKETIHLQPYYKVTFKDINDIEFMPINDWNSPNCLVNKHNKLKGKIRPIDIIEALEKENIVKTYLESQCIYNLFPEKYDYLR